MALSNKAPKFEVYADKAGKFRFRLVATNGETIAASEAYEAKRSALQTIKKFAETAAKAVVVDMTLAMPKTEKKK